MPRKKKSTITRALGQHMLVDRGILAKILYAAQITNHETVLEAGTGQGILTAELCRAAGHVVSYEVDSKLYRKAQEQFSSLQFKKLELVNADLFKTKDPHFYDVFVSNLPYSRSRDAVEWLSTQKFNRGIVMVQEEFADKLTAKPGSKNYRAISVLTAHCFAIEKLFKVRRQSFEPQPRVESAIIKIIPINTVTRETVGNINLLFSKRNKKAASVAAEAGIISPNYGSKRIDELEPQDLIKLAESISNVCSI
ncbi:MAG TPA: 16S rRNA (adenine(1518)-N(6)/adenine(1519)-N(6))-dimethyltransferase RsmA [Nitrososphaera sp.]|nr:16S rRNA (adenine(1518)-N(6)/adenine(1519)-N(6))-dimethyltransferase RsmA [Nitrososphaera sp.]